MSLAALIERTGLPATRQEWQESLNAPHVATFEHGERSPEFSTAGRLMAWLGANRKGRACVTSVVVKIEAEGGVVGYARYAEKGGAPC